MGWGWGAAWVFFPPVMNSIGMLHPLKVPFLPGEGGGTPWHGLSGDVPLDRVSFSKISQQNHSNKPVSVECVVDLDQYN